MLRGFNDHTKVDSVFEMVFLALLTQNLNIVHQEFTEKFVQQVQAVAGPVPSGRLSDRALLKDMQECAAQMLQRNASRDEMDSLAALILLRVAAIELVHSGVRHPALL